jgi:hypothetical protein
MLLNIYLVSVMAIFIIGIFAALSNRKNGSVVRKTKEVPRRSMVGFVFSRVTISIVTAYSLLTGSYSLLLAGAFGFFFLGVNIATKGSKPTDKLIRAVLFVAPILMSIANSGRLVEEFNRFFSLT